MIGTNEQTAGLDPDSGPVDPPPVTHADSVGAEPPLRSFLASGTVRCPGCAYDLKGCEEEICPECSWKLQLQLKPRVSFVPYWLFGLMIYGWLFVWGLSGVAATANRMWQYHGVVTNRWIRQYNAGQANAMVQQFLSRPDGPSTASRLPSGGTLAIPATAGPGSFLENLWNFYLAQTGVDQVSITLFLAGFVVGGTGLLLTPLMRRVSTRVNSWLILSGIAVFGAMILNHLMVYTAVLAGWR